MRLAHSIKQRNFAKITGNGKHCLILYIFQGNQKLWIFSCNNDTQNDLIY